MMQALKCTAELSIDEAIRETRKLGPGMSITPEIIAAVEALEKARELVTRHVTAERHMSDGPQLALSVKAEQRLPLGELERMRENASAVLQEELPPEARPVPGQPITMTHVLPGRGSVTVQHHAPEDGDTITINAKH